MNSLTNEEKAEILENLHIYIGEDCVQKVYVFYIKEERAYELYSKVIKKDADFDIAGKKLIDIIEKNEYIPVNMGLKGAKE